MSLRHDGLSWALIVLLLIVIGGAAAYAIAPQLKSRGTVRLGDGVFAARDAIDLSATESPMTNIHALEGNQLAVNVYPTDKKWPVKIKLSDVLLDIVWLDDEKRVVHIVKNVVSEDNTGKTFTPSSDSRFIIELPIGTVSKKAIKLGQIAIFDDRLEELVAK